MSKIYRRHYCDHQHRSHYVAAKCIFRRSTQRVDGDGPYAFVHKFLPPFGGFVRHVHLFPTLEAAQRQADLPVPCSGTCWGHEVVIIAPLNQLIRSWYP